MSNKLFVIERARPEEAAELLDYLKIVGGETDNLSFGAEGVLLSLEEDILQTALEIVTQDGYAALNIKAVAKKLGCSTAPMSWQFGGMEGLRQELIPFAEKLR